jgi:hypothetical protein
MIWCPGTGDSALGFRKLPSGLFGRAWGVREWTYRRAAIVEKSNVSDALKAADRE